MRKICVVTDSTADIPLEVAKEKNIVIVPLTVTYKGVNYKDGFEITTTKLLEMLSEGDELPKTSLVNPLQFYEVYQKLIGEGVEILSIHLSSNLSGTYQAALMAKDMLASDNIHIIDSKVVSFGTGILVLEAVRMIERGMEINEIKLKLQELSLKARVAFVVDTLEYLKKGGRLSSAQAAIGTLLNIKPILFMKEGKIEVYDKVRGMRKAQNRLIDYMRIEDLDKEMYSAVGNVGCPAAMMEFKNDIKNELSIDNLLAADVGSVVATYSGPGTIGIFFFKK